MDERENLQTAKRFYAAVNAHDLAAISKLLTDDIDWKDAVAGQWPGSTWCHGREEFERYGAKFFASLEVEEFRPDEFIVGRDSVVVLGTGRYQVHSSGRVVEASWVQIFLFRDGLICRFREYSDMAALAAGEAKEL